MKREIFIDPGVSAFQRDEAHVHKLCFFYVRFKKVKRWTVHQFFIIKDFGTELSDALG